MCGCYLLALCIGTVSMWVIPVLLKEQFTQKWNSVDKYSPSSCSPHYISGASQQKRAAAFSKKTEVVRDLLHWAWIVCRTPARTRLPVRLHCFPHTLVIVTLRSGVRSAPPHEAGSQPYSSPHVNSDDSQQTIGLYNLQPARNLFFF